MAGDFLYLSRHSFWGTGPESRKVQENHSSHWECNPVPPYHLWWEKKYYPGITRSFRGQTELNSASNQNLCHQHQACVKLQSVVRLLLLTDPSALPPPISFPSPSVTLFAYSLCVSPCMSAVVLYVLLYFSRYFTVRLKILCFLCYLCEYYKPITVQCYIADCVS